MERNLERNSENLTILKLERNSENLTKVKLDRNSRLKTEAPLGAQLGAQPGIACQSATWSLTEAQLERKY